MQSRASWNRSWGWDHSVGGGTRRTSRTGCGRVGPATPPSAPPPDRPRRSAREGPRACSQMPSKRLDDGGHLVPVPTALSHLREHAGERLPERWRRAPGPAPPLRRWGSYAGLSSPGRARTAGAETICVGLHALGRPGRAEAQARAGGVDRDDEALCAPRGTAPGVGTTASGAEATTSSTARRTMSHPTRPVWAQGTSTTVGSAGLMTIFSACRHLGDPHLHFVAARL